MNGTNRTSGGLAQVIVPNAEGVEIKISGKLPIEVALLQAYEVNLTQHKPTQHFMISTLKDKVGACATGECAKNLVLGKIHSLEGVYEATMEVLTYLILKEGTQLNYEPKPILPQKYQS